MAAAGHKGVKEARFDLMPSDALWYVARVFGKGAEKYAERNWERGLKWGSSKGALERHLALFWAGQDEDEESGLPHLAHVAWHSLVLLAMYLRGDGEDDRSTHEAVSTMHAEVTNPEDIEAARAEVAADSMVEGLGPQRYDPRCRLCREVRYHTVHEVDIVADVRGSGLGG